MSLVIQTPASITHLIRTFLIVCRVCTKFITYEREQEWSCRHLWQSVPPPCGHRQRRLLGAPQWEGLREQTQGLFLEAYEARQGTVWAFV